MLNTLDSADLRCGTFAIPEALIKELELKFKAGEQVLELWKSALEDFAKGR